MLAKTDSDLTILTSSNLDNDDSSMGPMSPGGSPFHHYRLNHILKNISPIYRSRESSTRFSAAVKDAYWRKIDVVMHHENCGDDEEEKDKLGFHCYVIMFVTGFLLLFSLFSLILWAASKAYAPKISLKSMVFDVFDIQAGLDFTGVPTKMISVNSTVKMRFRNPGTFFGVHVSSTPLQLYYYDLVVASGHMHEFYSSRKNDRIVSTAVVGSLVPLYGGGAGVTGHTAGKTPGAVPFNLKFTMKARANILGILVRSNFNRRIRCSVTLHETILSHPIDLRRACLYK